MNNFNGLQYNGLVMEWSHFERGRPPVPSRSKTGLETPLEGRFAKENRRLVFAPPVWYDLLIVACILTGLGLIALSFFAPAFAPLQFYGYFVGTMIAGAGIWGALSNERMSCNITAKTYARLEGQGLRKRLVQGTLTELDAIVLVSEESLFAIPGSRGVIYRLVLHWKGSSYPLLVVEREVRAIASNVPINHSAGAILQRGQSYAQALGVRFFDNSYFSSPCPVPFV